MVKVEYKETEVGPIPASWQFIVLSKLISIVHGYGFQSQYFDSYGLYRLMTPGHFYEEGGFREIGEKQKYYNGPIPSDYILNAGDLIVAMTEQADGLLGSAALVPPNAPYLHNQRLGKVKSNSQFVDTKYIYYLFNSSNYRRSVRETAAGTKVKHTSPQKLLEIKVPVPQYPEQQAIAEALSDVDGLIAGLDKLIAKKRAIKTATMQVLLTGEKRLPGFGNGKGYKQTEIGRVPEDWEITNLGNHAEITKLAGFEYTNHFNSYKDGGEIVVVRGTNITNNILDLSDIKTIPKSISDKLPRSKLKKGDLVFAYVGTIGPVFLITENNKYHLGPNTARITCKHGLYPDFLFIYFTGPLITGEINEKISVGAQPSLSMTKIRSFKLLLPPEREQRAIAQILLDINAEIAALEARRAKTQVIKQGMMQELLTGRTRLPL